MTDNKHIFKMHINKGGQESTFVVTRLKTAIVVPLQQLIIDYTNGLNTEDFIVRSCKLVADAINEPEISAKVVEDNSSIEELMSAIVAMRIWCMSILGGNGNPKLKGVPEQAEK